MSKDTRNAIIRGQIISIFIAGTGVFATLLSSTTPSSNFPSLMSLFNYALLTSFLFRNRCSTLRLSHNQAQHDYEEATLTDSVTDSKVVQENSSALINGASHMSTPKYLNMLPQYFWYALAALLDLEANFLVINAYNYTTVTSIMLLDCFTIPCVMTLSYFLLNYHYFWKHIFGIAICLSGVGLIVYADFSTDDQPASATNPVIGDMLCLVGSALYACSNVLQETMVKTSSREVYLGYLGLFGSIFAFIQCMAIDLTDLEEANIGPVVALYMVGFVLCLFFMYTNTSIFLQDSDSTLFNLSLLTSDVYAVIFSYFLYGELVNWLYFVAFSCVVCGLFLYHSTSPPFSTSSLLRRDSAYEDLRTPAHDTGGDLERLSTVNEGSSLFAHSGTSNNSSSVNVAASIVHGNNTSTLKR